MPKLRGQNFTEMEMYQMLDLIDAKRPVTIEDWDEVGRLHAINFPDKHRTGTAIKRRYMVLYLSKIRPSDPNCPPNVRRAIEIYHKIKDKVRLGRDNEQDNENDDAVINDVLENGTVDGDDPGNVNGSAVATSEGTLPVGTGPAPTNTSITRTADASMISTNVSIPAIRMRPESLNESAKYTSLKKQRTDEESGMDKFLQYLMIQSQLDKEERREERKRQQEEERIRREEERIRHEEERAQRQQQNSMMQMMMISLMSSNPTVAQTQQQLGISSLQPTQVDKSTASLLRIMNSAAATTNNNNNPEQYFEHHIPHQESKNDVDDERKKGNQFGA